MIVERVCDEQWLESATAMAASEEGEGIGVLDPTCGSGTFLYHAARRIVDHLDDQGWTDTQRANIACRLVRGMDIHPVAVEIARASLLRALPTMPSAGTDSLAVWQADALLLPVYYQGSLFQTTDMGYNIDTPGGRNFLIPRGFVANPNFSQRLRQLVTGASRQAKEPAAHLVAGLNENDQVAVCDAHTQLAEIIKQEGNGVWAWYAYNRISAIRLSEIGVDRIVANPPWVRMSNIQVEERKNLLERTARNEHLWPGGRNATGFDIAALFIKRCDNLYLREKTQGVAGGWLTNHGSLQAGNWTKFRSWLDDRAQGAASTIDLGEIHPQPFTGAKSAIWYTCRAAYHTNTVLTASTRIPQEASWLQVQQLVAERVAIQHDPQPSDYLDRTRKPLARNGATLFPHCLIMVNTHKPANTEGRVQVTACHSRQKPWKYVTPIKGTIPDHWLQPAIFSANLLPYRVSAETLCVIPLTKSADQLEQDPAATEQYWANSEAEWANWRGRGQTTPKTLIDQIDYQGKLTAQLTITKGWTVVYNKSGQMLRATRVRNPVIVDNSCYRLNTTSGDEAAYLVALLNADILQDRYRQARKSDRHFDQHVWREVPIPRYDPDNSTHHKLVVLCEQAEATAAALTLQGGQLKQSNAIRAALQESKLSEAINQVATTVVDS